MLPISPLALTHDVGRIQLREGDALCHFYSNMLYLCFFAQHIRLSKRALSCTLFVWGHHHTANSLKLSHVQIKPLILVYANLITQLLLTLPQTSTNVPLATSFDRLEVALGIFFLRDHSPMASQHMGSAVNWPQDEKSNNSATTTIVCQTMNTNIQFNKFRNANKPCM